MVAVLLFSSYLIQKIQVKLGRVDEYEHVLVNENLPRFFQAIRYSSAKQMLAENQNVKVNYGFEISNYRVLNELEKV